MKRKENWIRIRKELYLQLEKEVSQRLGRTSDGLLRYKAVYEKAFSAKWAVSTSEEFFSVLHSARVLLLGDFHALHQSQKSHLRILRKLIGTRPLVLAVEFLDAEDQPWVDQFLEGNLSEKQFLENVQWVEKWGFPWESYQPIFEWARKEGVSIYAVNQTFKSRTAATLEKRDEFSAQMIADIVHAYSDSIVVVIYGDLHLADEHLVEKIYAHSFEVNPTNLVRVYQNSEILYFKLMELGIDAQTDILRAEGNQFCLMSVAPWVKWQNYLLYLEQAYDQELVFDSDYDDEEYDEDDDYGDEFSIDFTDHVVKFAKIISQDLSLPLSVGELSVYSLKDSLLFEKIESEFEGEELGLIRSLISDQRSFYLPELQLGVLVRPTVNHAAQLAMSYLLSQVGEEKRSFLWGYQEIEKLILRECLIYFGSKLINPRQKTDTLSDLQANIHLKESQESVKEALQVALSQKMQELLRGAGMEPSSKVFSPKNRYSYLVAAQILGRMMGEKLFFAYQKEKISPDSLKKLILLDLKKENFIDIYLRVARKIDSLPAPFKSKKDRL